MRGLLGGNLNIISCGGAVLGGVALAEFIMWGFESFFIFRAAKAADAESLRLLFIQLPILSFFFFAIRDRTFFTRIKKIRKNTAQFLLDKSP